MVPVLPSIEPHKKIAISTIPNPTRASLPDVPAKPSKAADGNTQAPLSYTA